MFRRSTLSPITRPLSLAALLIVSLVPAFAQGPAATVLEQIGQVSVLKDGNAVALFPGQSIRADQIIVTGAQSYAKFRVSDGTEFEVFENSRVTFHDRGGSWKDLLNVFMGHVKVYVQHIFGPNPTSVTSPTAVISVRGTVFDVQVENEEGDTLVSVDEGKVEVEHRLLPSSKLLLPGQSVTVYHDVPLLAQQIDKSGAAQKVFASVQKAVRDLIMMRPGGVGGIGSPVPGGPAGVGGAQGDKGKGGTGNGGKSGGQPPAAGTPPAAPTPPKPPGGG